MRRALRSKHARPQQALGLNRSLRDRLIEACPATLTGLRDRAMIALGYDTLCRRAELVGLRAEDITPVGKNSAQILVRRSKTDPYGSGRLAYVSPSTLEIVRAWLKAAGIESGYIFRAVLSERIGDAALHPYTVNRVLKKVARAAGVPGECIEHLSGAFHARRRRAGHDRLRPRRPADHAGGRLENDKCRRALRRESQSFGASRPRPRRPDQLTNSSSHSGAYWKIIAPAFLQPRLR